MSLPPSFFIRSILGQLTTAPLVTRPIANAAWPCWLANMPDGTDVNVNAVCCYDDQGVKQGKLARTREVVERRAVQIMVRASDYKDGYTKGWSIALRLDDVVRQGFDIDGDGYSIPAIRRSGFFPLGQDPVIKKPRFWFSINVDFILTYHGPIAALDTDFPITFDPIDETWFT